MNIKISNLNKGKKTMIKFKDLSNNYNKVFRKMNNSISSLQNILLKIQFNQQRLLI